MPYFSPSAIPDQILAAGDPAASYVLHAFDSGASTTPRTMYTDNAGTSAGTTITLDTDGYISTSGTRHSLWLDELINYRLELRDTSSTVIWQVDNVKAFNQITINSITRTSIKAYLENKEVASYAEFKALTSSQLGDGEVIHVTNDGVRGPFVVKTGTVTNNDGTLLVFTDDSNRYGERIREFVTPEMFGVTSSADSTTQMQAFLDHIRDTGEAGQGTGETYRLDGVITLLSNSTSPKNYVIDFMGSLLDWSNSILTSGDLFTIGATTTANAHDKEQIDIRNFDYIGPEPALTTTPSTSLTGVLLDNCLNASIHNITGRRVYRGIHTRFCFPLTATSIKIRETYEPFYIDDDCTLATWMDCGATDSRYSVIVKPTTNTKTISNQTFINFRTEGCSVGPVLDPLDGSGTGIDNVNFINPYYENNTYDYNRHGIEYTFSTPQTRGADRTRTVSGCDIIGGIWSKAAAWDTAPPGAPLVCSTTGTVKFGDYRMGCTRDDIIGTPNKYRFMSAIDQLTGDGTNFELISSAVGLVIFAGGTGTIQHRQGNIAAASVTRVSAGTYDIALTEAYDGAASITVTGSCDGASLQVDSANTTSSNVRVNCENDSGTLVDPTNVRVRVEGPIT